MNSVEFAAILTVANAVIEEAERHNDPTLAEIRLRASLLCLRETISYLSDQLEAGLLRPLFILYAEAHDVGRGAAPRLVIPKPPNKTRPTILIGDFVKGDLGFAAEVLRRAGYSRAEMKDILTAECRRHQLRDEDGKPVMGAKIVRWRDELNNRRASVAAVAEFEHMRKSHAERLRCLSELPVPEQRGNARAFAASIIISLAVVARDSAPAALRR